MMLMRDLFGLSLHNLLLHKVRSILTSLGVIFGVGSVIAMLAISEGAKRSALAQIEAMGIDKIILFSKRPPVDGKSESSDNAGVMERYGLSAKDVSNIMKMDNIERITTVFDARKKVLKGLQRTDLKLIGCDYQFLQDSSAKIEKGRWFSPADYQNNALVCVIGKNVKRRLFAIGDTDVVGGSIRIEDMVFRIVGIVDNVYGTQYPEIGGQNDMIFIPITTARALYKDYTFVREGYAYKITRIEYDLFLVKIADTSYIDNTSKRIARYLEKAHTDTKDWGMVVPLELLRQRERTQNIFTIVMGSIAGISLVVGGIGIMNIMLASVFERRKEIGTRRALGAQKADILLQFLIETVFLTSLGGIIGITLGVGIGSAITYYSKMPTIYSAWSIILSLAISSITGVIFGTYPAYKAAQQNPITVLRAE
ncbi:MAG: ABC transporter permease [Victivallales bacterium]|jgi:putative ABC transport system permease protein|nr:ABC transporter permease [Victivallales bacterium]